MRAILSVTTHSRSSEIKVTYYALQSVCKFQIMFFRCCSIWTNVNNCSKHFSGLTLYCHHQHRAQINCGKHLGRSQMTHKGWSRNSKPPGELSMQKQYIPSSLLSSLAHKTWGYNWLWETRHSGYASVQRAQAVHGINVLLPKFACYSGCSLCVAWFGQ